MDDETMRLRAVVEAARAVLESAVYVLDTNTYDVAADSVRALNAALYEVVEEQE